MANGKLSMPVATLTKTKLNIQQTALVGIAAVATAALLGAFSAQFAASITMSLTTDITACDTANVACKKPVTLVSPASSGYQQYSINRGYVPANLTDNTSKFAYASDFKYGYEINLQGTYYVTGVSVDWGQWFYGSYTNTNSKMYMQDYHIYGLRPDGRWIEITGATEAPSENMSFLDTTTTDTMLPLFTKIRVTSGWGLQTDGQWGTSGFKAGKNWLGVQEVRVTAQKLAALPMAAEGSDIDYASGSYGHGNVEISLFGGDIARGIFIGQNDYLMIKLETGWLMTVPPSEYTINIAGSVKTIYLPSISFTKDSYSYTNAIVLYVAADGSTYYAHSSHGPILAKAGANYVDLELVQALQPTHLARQAPSSAGVGVGRGGGVPTNPAPMGVPPTPSSNTRGAISPGTGAYNSGKVTLQLHGSNDLYGRTRRYGVYSGGRASNFGYLGPADYLVAELFSSELGIAIPPTEFTISIGNGTKTIYLPGVTFSGPSNIIAFYVAEDGSTYYASSGHQPVQGPYGQVNLGLFEALKPEHLARKAGPNLLSNPSFETGSPSATGVWGDYTPSAQTTILKATKAHSGSASAEVRTYVGGLYKRFTIGTGLKAGTSYQLSSYLQKDPASTHTMLSVCVQYYKDNEKDPKASGFTIDCTGNVASQPAGQWQLSQLTFTTTSKSNVSKDVNVYVGYAGGGLPAGGRFYIDDAKLIEVK